MNVPVRQGAKPRSGGEQEHQPARDGPTPGRAGTRARQSGRGLTVARHAGTVAGRQECPRINAIGEWDGIAVKPE